MRIRQARSLWAPNVWFGREAFDATVEIDAHSQLTALPELVATLDRLFPVRREWFGPFPGGAAVPEEEASILWPMLFAQTALALQGLARSPVVREYRVVATCEPSLFRVALGVTDPLLVERCAREAVDLLTVLQRRESVESGKLVADLVDYADDVCIGPSTMLIVSAAGKRGIPFRRIGDLSLIQFGQGRFQRRIWTAETDRTPAIAEAISRDKQLTKQMLRCSGVPVPEGGVVHDVEAAWRLAERIGAPDVPVVVKPLDGNHGRGVFLNLRTRAEIEGVFSHAAAEGSAVIVESFVTGVEHRLLVVGDRMVACSRGEYAIVTGNGRDDVRTLVETQLNSDASRGTSETLPNNAIEIDATVVAQLAQEGFTPESVPPEGLEVLVKRMGTHGPDVTDDVHPEIAAAAVRAAQAVGLDIAGVDLVAEDVSRPLAEQGAMVCEVNAGPQLLIHAHPRGGKGRPVGEAIVERLFPEGDAGRIPVVGVMGRGADETVRLIAGMLAAAGYDPGLTCAAGAWVSGWRTSTRDQATSTAARDLMSAVTINAAVCELDWRSVCEFGVPVDRFDVLVLLPESDPDPVDPADLDRVESPREAFLACLKGISRRGCVVLVEGAGEFDPALLEHDGEVIVVERVGNPEGASHGGDVTRFTSVAGSVRVARPGRDYEPLLDMGTLQSVGGKAQPDVTVLLSAIAAARGLGVSPAFIAAGWDRYL
jgi:cyanophycin synthetase